MAHGLDLNTNVGYVILIYSAIFIIMIYKQSLDRWMSLLNQASGPTWLLSVLMMNYQL